MFQNYLGVGVDAAAALKFHKARETNPAMFISAATNKLMYGLFGAYDFIFHSHRDLREQVKVFADGEEIDLPRDAEGVILLNINSYAGGVKMWEKGKRGRFRNWLGSWLSGGYGDSTEERWDPRGPGSIPEGAESEYKEKPKKLSVREKVRAVWRRRRARRAKARLQRSFGKSRKSDGLIDVVVVYGALHLGQLSCGTDRPVRICQARRVRLETRRTLPVQADGQPWEQPASVFDVSLRNRATMLRAPEGHHAAPVAWQSTLPMPPDTDARAEERGGVVGRQAAVGRGGCVWVGELGGSVRPGFRFEARRAMSNRSGLVCTVLKYQSCTRLLGHVWWCVYGLRGYFRNAQNKI